MLAARDIKMSKAELSLASIKFCSMGNRQSKTNKAEVCVGGIASVTKTPESGKGAGGW